MLMADISIQASAISFYYLIVTYAYFLQHRCMFLVEFLL